MYKNNFYNYINYNTSLFTLIIFFVRDMRNGPESVDIDKFLNLKDKPVDINNSLIFKEKENLLNFLSNNSRHKIINVDTLYIGTKDRFGNQLIILSKAIFFFVFLGCKKIILDKFNRFIKNDIHF